MKQTSIDERRSRRNRHLLIFAKGNLQDAIMNLRQADEIMDDVDDSQNYCVEVDGKHYFVGGFESLVKDVEKLIERIDVLKAKYTSDIVSSTLEKLGETK